MPITVVPENRVALVTGLRRRLEDRHDGTFRSIVARGTTVSPACRRRGDVGKPLDLSRQAPLAASSSCSSTPWRVRPERLTFEHPWL